MKGSITMGTLPVRVLHIVRKMDMGGVQSMIMNYYRNIDRSKIQFDFVVQEKETGYFDREIELLGGKIYRIPPVKNIISYYQSLNKIFKENDYEIIHTHQNFANVHALFLAYINQIRNRISHSHNNFQERRIIRKFIKIWLRILINKFSTEKFACSINAGIWLYGKKMYDNGKVTIINNAIETEKFVFNMGIRERLRENLKLDNSLVVGHIGNFFEQKNHKFIIEIFEEIYKNNYNSVLLLVGKGELRVDIEKLVKNKGLDRNVFFLGVRKDISDLLNIFDVFIFPSFHEGLPVTLVEAQASGLKCIISDKITKEIDLTGLTEYLPLEKGAKYWANVVLNSDSNIIKRKNMAEEIIDNAYDIKLESLKLQKIYESLI